jgi:hypothetical protein
MAGLERALPASYYLDEAAFRRERERLLYREWFCVGRSDQLPGPGRFWWWTWPARACWSSGPGPGSCAPTTTSAATAAPR